MPALNDFLTTSFTFPKPMVAAVNGHAIAGGALLAASADYRLMSAGRIGVPELLVGVPFPAIALEILRFAAGRDAHWLALSGRTITPDEARQAGLVDEVVAAAELLPRASVIARQLAAIDPENFSMAKRQLRAEALQRVEQARDADARAMEIWKAPGTHAAIRAYLDKTVKRG
jgi:enoyl-CoA hydratase